MSLKLYTYPGNFRAFKILVAAEYNGIDIEIPDFKMLEDNKTPEFLAKSPLGKVPVLDTPQGSIFESNAIARYVARMRRDTELYGVSFFESAQVDSWIDFSTQEVELPATMWFYPVIGYMPFNPLATEKAKTDLAKALGVLEGHLLDKTYLVGDKITLADITLCSTLVYPMKLVMDAAYRADFPCVQRWFTTVVNQPQFKAVVGEVVLCETELTASGAPAPAAGGGKKDKKAGKAKGGDKKGGDNKKGGDKPKKEKAAKKEKAPAPAPAPAPTEKKEEHVLKVLDKTSPSPFNNDTWKKEYSNCTSFDAAMATFWEMFDAEGWSLWKCTYNYNAENTVMFMTSNLVSGFVQRSGEIRKWGFGVMQIVGEGPFEVVGVWLMRGQEIKPLLDANDDAEYYTWTKIAAPVSDADKAMISEMWCSETTIEGKKIQDCKVFK
mmetsp:Transcript_20433/g.33572  ORF Transcript_20433/g.33572 Transcript_20433/m.33572 type:complete len:437 (+) Transcript_20433:91-1401(+)